MIAERFGVQEFDQDGLNLRLGVTAQTANGRGLDVRIFFAFQRLERGFVRFVAIISREVGGHLEADAGIRLGG